MITRDELNQLVTFDSKDIRYVVDYNGSLTLKSMMHKPSGREWLQHECEFFTLDVLDKHYTSADFTLDKLDIFKDEVQELLSFEISCKEEPLRMRLSIVTDDEDSCTMLYQMGAQWENNVPQEVYIHVPLFEAMDHPDQKWYLATNPVEKPDGTSAMQVHREFELPICNIASDHKTGFSMELHDNPLYSDKWNQNRNVELIRMTTREQLLNNHLLLRIYNKEFADIFEFRFFALDGGWPQAFNTWKRHMREGIDFSEYHRADIDWYKKVVYQHFTFAYSREVFDYETKKFDPDKLIDAGMEVGGYDTVLLWYQYPRLGVDERKQWDFNHDVPNGLDGMKAFTDRCHERGVRVFLPYKPWDIRAEETTDSILEELANLIEKTGIDGIWFDTMNAVPKGYRERMDKIRPGILFCIEGFPASIESVETITGSWDQHWNDPNMPETFILRYLFPENNAAMTSRWKIGEGKDMLIQRAMFNGTGLVMWQDIFGAWLPFSAEQKAMLKKWKKILLDNFDIYFGESPIPLFPSLDQKLYVNRFSSNDGSAHIFSIYNSSDKAISGQLVDTMVDAKAACELLNDASVELCGSIISGEVAPGQLLIVKITC